MLDGIVWRSVRHAWQAELLGQVPEQAQELQQQELHAGSGPVLHAGSLLHAGSGSVLPAPGALLHAGPGALLPDPGSDLLPDAVSLWPEH